MLHAPSVEDARSRCQTRARESARRIERRSRPRQSRDPARRGASGRACCRRSRRSRPSRCASPRATGSSAACTTRKRCARSSTPRRGRRRSRSRACPAATDWASLRYRPVVADRRVSCAQRQILIDNKVHDGPRRLSRRDAARARRRPRRARRSRLDRAGRVASDAARRAAARGRRQRCAGASRFRPPAISSSSPKPRRGPVWQNLDPARFAAATGVAVLPVVIERRRRRCRDDGLVRDWPAPDFGIDTHRIYMVQWYAFALARRGPVALVQPAARSAAGRDG